MKRRFKNSNLSLHDQTWFLKQQKKNQFKATTTIHFIQLLQLATGIFMCIRRSFSVCIQWQKFQKKKIFFVLALKFTLLFLEYGNPCGFFIHFVLLYCFPNEVPGFCRYTQKKIGKICICFTRSYNI